MVRDHIVTLNMSEENIRKFMKFFKAFMKKEVLPRYVGVTTLEFHIELAAKGGFNIICETNKQLNDASQLRVRNLTKGFIAGAMMLLDDDTTVIINPRPMTPMPPLVGNKHLT